MDSFTRLEEKYLLPQFLVKEFHQLLLDNSKPNYPNSKTHYYLIESLYYDSQSLNIYQNHFLSEQRRSKLRSRRYAPNGVWSDTIHLELKVKENSVCNKERLKITEEDEAFLKKGMPLEYSEKLQEKNSSILTHELQERVERINTEFLQYNLLPFCRVLYKRHAFEDNGFRVTYDEDLSFDVLRPINARTATSLLGSSFWERAALMRNSYRNSNAIVVELKHSGVIPQWMVDFLTSHASPKVSFSKYCYAVTESLQQSA